MLVGSPSARFGCAVADAAPACVRALADASRVWPGRSVASDGIMGDAAHLLGPSDHNDGNAFDLTHDPLHGVDGENIARIALADRRTRFVVWRRTTHKRGVIGGPVTSEPNNTPDPHESHVHVSIWPELRADASPWAWSSSGLLVVAVAGVVGVVGGVGLWYVWKRARRLA